jgi:DNA-directed RNA polymerase subunit RPC12/RpoP
MIIFQSDEGISLYLIVFILLAFMIFLHSKNTVYICKNCNHEFEISFWQDFSSMHSPGKKMLKCPACSVKNYAFELVKTRSNLKG